LATDGREWEGVGRLIRLWKGGGDLFHVSEVMQ